MSWIFIQLYEEEGVLKFDPAKDKFKQEIEEIVYGTLSSVCSEHFQFLHLEQFDEYWQCSIEAQKTDEHIEIKSIISINPEFNKKISTFKMQVKRSFQILQNYAKIYQPSLQFLGYMKKIEEIDFTQQNTDFFKEVMYQCKIEIQSLSEIQPEKELGIIMLKSQDYKSKIIKKYE